MKASPPIPAAKGPATPKALALSALLSAVALGGVLSAGAARADSYSCGFDSMGVLTGCNGAMSGPVVPLPSGDYQFAVADKQYTLSSAPIAFTSGTSTAPGNLAFHSPSPGYYTGEFAFLTPPGGAGLNGPSGGTFTYDIKITDPTMYFGKAWLDSVVNVPGGITGGITVNKTIKFLDIVAPDWNVGTSTDGSSTAMVPFPSMSQHIRVTDTFNVPTSTQQLRSGTNTFTQTPGPLGVMGAGAAFGFSRKLRGRIRQARGV